MTPRQLMLMQGGGNGSQGGMMSNTNNGPVASSLFSGSGFSGLAPKSMSGDKGWGGRIGSVLGSSLMSGSPMGAALGSGFGGYAGGWSPGRAASVGLGTLALGPVGGMVAGKLHNFWSAPGSGFFGMANGVNRSAQELSAAQSIAQEDAAMNASRNADGMGGGFDGYSGGSMDSSNGGVGTGSADDASSNSGYAG